MRPFFFILQRWVIPKNEGFLKKMSLVSLLTVVLSTFLALVVMVSINYIHKEVENSLVLEDFHLSLSSKKPLSAKKFNRIKNNLTKTHNLKGIMPYYSLQGLLFNGHIKTPAFIQVVPKSFFNLMSLHLAKGVFNTEIPSITLNSYLAQQLGVKIGDIVSFMHLNSSNETSKIKLQVTGIIHASPLGKDLFAVAPFLILKNYLNEAPKIGILLKDTSKIKTAEFYLNYKENLYVSNYISKNKNLLMSFKWETILFMFILAVIVMISFLIIYMGFKITLDYSFKSISILRILGISQKQMMGLFFVKSLLIALIGSFIGFSLMIILFYYLIPLLFFIATNIFGIFLPQESYLSFIHQEFFLGRAELSFLFSLEFFSIFLALFYPFLKRQNTPLLTGLTYD